MTQPVRLLPMQCVKCQNPIPAQLGETAWVCSVCGQGQLLSMEKGLIPQEICYSDQLKPGNLARPFWVARGEVNVEREVYRGDESRASSQFWSQPHWFFIPAYEISLEELLAVGGAMLRQPPQLAPCSQNQVAFRPVIRQPGDMVALVEFIIMSVEAERSDFVREVNIQLKLDQPELWILP